ncbi:Holliday junction resolvase RecU, partial [Streptococcus oralis]
MVNYPHKISSQKRQAPLSQTKNFANRGMSFEKMINATNDYYLSHGLAVIHKKPTPIQIVRVDYPQRSRAKIVEAYFRQASTTDYSGVYDGYYIDFEAKETRQKHAIPMKNFHLHQIQHMEQVLAQQGICFVLLHFSSQQETYLLPAIDLIRFYHQDKGQKSMPLGYIRENG